MFSHRWPCRLTHICDLQLLCTLFVIPLLRPSKGCSASVQVALWTWHLSTNTHPHSLCILLINMWTTHTAYSSVKLSTQNGKPSAVVLHSYTNTSSIHNMCVPGVSNVHTKCSICFTPKGSNCVTSFFLWSQKWCSESTVKYILYLWCTHKDNTSQGNHLSTENWVYLTLPC